LKIVKLSHVLIEYLSLQSLELVFVGFLLGQVLLLLFFELKLLLDHLSNVVSRAILKWLDHLLVLLILLYLSQ